MNDNLIRVLEPLSYVRRPGHNRNPKPRVFNERIYYRVNRRCREDSSHNPRPLRVFLDTLGSDGLKNVFDDVSTHCLACGAEEYERRRLGAKMSKRKEAW